MSQKPEKQHFWIPRARDFEEENKTGNLTFETVKDEHPLYPSKTSSKEKVQEESQPKPQPKKEEKPVSDPLAFGDPLAGTFDPLTGDYVQIGVTANRTAMSTTVNAEDDYPNWDNKKGTVLAKYTTSKAISVPSFIQGVVAKSNVPVDRVKNRLEQLDQDEEEGEMLKLTQKDYQKHIERRRDELIKAWDDEKRVKALKTAIKCAKLLGDTNEVVQFYPSKFVIVTEILDAFGNLVFDRIKRKSAITDDNTVIPLKDNFRCEDVADTAKETCKNWFFKIASIRELLPRIFVEMAILQSYRFIENDNFAKHFDRITLMIRGIADPLVAMYARAYLARKGKEVLRNNRKYLMQCFEDYLTLDKHIKSEKMQKFIELRGIDLQQYYDLFSPSLDWILECVAYKADYRVLEDVLSKMGSCTNGHVLSAIISSFQPRLISRYALDFIKYVKKAEYVDKMDLYRTLGVCLTLAEPPEQAKLPILEEVWKDARKETDIKKYILLAEVFISYPLTYLSFKETDILLKDILEHISVDKQYFDYQTHLQSIMGKVLARADPTNFFKLFGMKNFLPFIDIFRGETQTEVNKSILSAFLRTDEKITDTITINTLFSVTKTVHDSLTALSFADDRREISRLLCQFLHRVDFGKDLEKKLNFLVEARRAFANLDPVKSELVKMACSLAIQTQNLVKGKLNKQSSAFVRACIAFCYITIPSMEDVFERLYLFVVSSQVAFLSQSVPQAESFIKSCITLIQEVPQHIEESDGKPYSTSGRLISFLKYFISFLVAVPGHPEHGAFYLLTPLLKVIKDYEWDAKSTGRITCYIYLLTVCAANSQKNLPYEWDKIDSNTLLFGRTEQYLKDYRDFISQLLDEITTELTRLGQYEDSLSQKAQAEVVLDIVITTLIWAEPSPAVEKFVTENYIRAKKLRAETSQLELVISYVKNLLGSVPTNGTSGDNEKRRFYEKVLNGFTLAA